MSTATAPADQNKPITDEFRSNDGVVGGYFAGVPLVLVHHKGAKSGTERIVPLASQKQDDGWAVFASKGGADDNPAWYYNLLANPETTIEVGTHVTLKKKFRCAKTVVTKGTIGRVLWVHDGHLWMNVTQDNEKIGTGALQVQRKNVCTLAGCIPRRWEVAADFASHVTELLLGTLCSPPRAHATATHHTE